MRYRMLQSGEGCRKFSEISHWLLRTEMVMCAPPLSERLSAMRAGFRHRSKLVQCSRAEGRADRRPQSRSTSQDRGSKFGAPAAPENSSRPHCFHTHENAPEQKNPAASPRLCPGGRRRLAARCSHRSVPDNLALLPLGCASRSKSQDATHKPPPRIFVERESEDFSVRIPQRSGSAGARHRYRSLEHRPRRNNTDRLHSRTSQSFSELSRPSLQKVRPISRALERVRPSSRERCTRERSLR